MHLFGPKISRQLSVVDLIQQHLLIRRWHHQSRLLFCALKNQFKPIFGHNMKLSMIPRALRVKLPSFQRLKDPMWPDKHVPRKRVQQPTMKQRLKHDPQQQQHENQSP